MPSVFKANEDLRKENRMLQWKLVAAGQEQAALLEGQMQMLEELRTNLVIQKSLLRKKRSQTLTKVARLRTKLELSEREDEF